MITAPDPSLPFARDLHDDVVVRAREIRRTEQTQQSLAEYRFVKLHRRRMPWWRRAILWIQEPMR